MVKNAPKALGASAKTTSAKIIMCPAPVRKQVQNQACHVRQLYSACSKFVKNKFINLIRNRYYRIIILSTGENQ
jgi:hypothetical protein